MPQKEKNRDSVWVSLAALGSGPSAAGIVQLALPEDCRIGQPLAFQAAIATPEPLSIEQGCEQLNQSGTVAATQELSLSYTPPAKSERSNS